MAYRAWRGLSARAGWGHATCHRGTSPVVFHLSKYSPVSTPFTPYSTFLARHFAGKVQKLPVDCGATCPVRDGTLSTAGCAFCNGRSFVPAPSSRAGAVREQLERGKRFFARRTAGADGVTYLAYFQAGSNTWAPPAEMSPRFEEALATEGVGGLVIATRPDCLGDEWLDCLERFSRRTFVMVELGVESTTDRVLHALGRGHDVACSRRAIEALAARGLPVGVHLILGLPGETRGEMLSQASWLSALPMSVVKLHQLQVVRGSRLGEQWLARPGSVPVMSAEAYVGLVADYLERLSPRIAVERFVSQSPGAALLAPRWGLKNDAVTRLIVNELARRGSHQGLRCGE